MENKKNFYKPKVMSQKDIDESLKSAFKSSTTQKKITLSTTPSNIYRPPTMKPQQEQYPSPRFGQPQKSLYKQPEPQPKQEEEPYWSAQEWETWALQLYQNFEDARQYLPDWFLEAVE